MSLRLQLRTRPEVPVEADALAPDRLQGLKTPEVESLPLIHGNENCVVGDFFAADGECNGELHLEGDLSRIKHLGSGMKSGTLHIHGDAGAHLGVGMSGGQVIVDGNAGDWVGPEMSGGRICVKGNAGHMVGAAYRGSPMGMTGGEIIIGGCARNELGHGMRNGLIAVGGDSGDFTGVNMLAGTIIVLGRLGLRPGASMKRGTIVTLHDSELLPTFSYACCFRPPFLGLYLLHLRQLDLAVADAHISGRYARWCGDSIELNRGEILLYKT
ncbi:MAG: formylmethanofuran dehydrogenase subunit C [Gammaproteobacteria bacterium]|nr:formylmethanofuran dehydrogenase subunit C [Gammaproteobacteria bacterium]